MAEIEVNAQKCCDGLDKFSFSKFEAAFFPKSAAPENLKALFDKVVQELRQNGQISTASAYNSANLSLHKFKPVLKLEHVTPEFLRNYERWFIAQGKSPATVSIYLRSLRAIMNWAIEVVKENGAVKYVGAGDATVYNDITTDKGRQWQLTLPDGSRVWLNAASSIHYPLRFGGKERLVEITGEAYFEVVHNAAQPFRVKACGTVVEDVGTAFNVNAYTDEPGLKTTLVEGAVSVGMGNGKAKVVLCSRGSRRWRRMGSYGRGRVMWGGQRHGGN